EAGWQFARDRKVEYMRVRRFQLVIQTPGDREGSGRRCGSEAAAWRRLDQSCRNIGQPIKAWDGVYVLNTRRVREGSGQSKRALAIESVCNALPEMVIVDSIAAANGALAGAAK